MEPKRSLKTKLLTIHQKNVNGVLDRSGKAPTEKKRGKGKGEKEGKTRKHDPKTTIPKRKLQSKVKLTRRKGTVTTEDNLHTIQPLFIQKY